MFSGFFLILKNILKRKEKILSLGEINVNTLQDLAYMSDLEFDEFYKKISSGEFVYYAGYDMLHKECRIKNFYFDTKENIKNLLRSKCEFIEGTTEEEVEEHLNQMIDCYTHSVNKIVL